MVLSIKPAHVEKAEHSTARTLFLTFEKPRTHLSAPSDIATMPTCAHGNCTRLADGLKPCPSYCPECTISRQGYQSTPRAKALQAYSDYKRSTRLRNITRDEKGKDPVDVCSQQEYLACCFTSEYIRKPCAGDGCDQRSTTIDRVDTSILTYTANCQPLCHTCNSSKGG
jgi:hypothetical protein